MASAAGSAADAAGSKLSSAADKATSAAAQGDLRGRLRGVGGRQQGVVGGEFGEGRRRRRTGGGRTPPPRAWESSWSAANGMTLYMYDPDAAWHLDLLRRVRHGLAAAGHHGAPTAAGQADAALLKTAPRTDGTTQVVYGNWPLYYWQKDTKPGDVTGQGGRRQVVGRRTRRPTPIKTPAG